jgi:hypothetical protein
MAKQCMLQREVKRTKLVAKYSKKRKEILSDLKTANNLTEIFAMQKSYNDYQVIVYLFALRIVVGKRVVVVVFIVILVFHAMFYEKWHTNVYFPV